MNQVRYLYFNVNTLFIYAIQLSYIYIYLDLNEMMKMKFFWWIGKIKNQDYKWHKYIILSNLINKLNKQTVIKYPELLLDSIIW